MSEDTTRLISEIGILKARCEELVVRNEMLEYHLERKSAYARELERELAEWRAAHAFKTSGVPLGWGKGKDE